MDNITNCSQNTDSLKLVREGTSQEQRFSPALDPAYAPVDERTVAHRMVFAQAYAVFLKYYNSSNAWEGDWQAFFNNDVSMLLAVAAVQDVDDYRSNIKGYFDFLKTRDNQSKEQDLKNNLGYLFSCAGTLAKQLDMLKEGLPAEIPLKGTLQNLIQNQLSGEFKRLISYYKADLPASDRLVADVQPGISILGKTTEKYVNIYQDGLSKDWTGNAVSWASYTSSIPEDSSVYGSGSTVFERINHIATHNLFSSIFDQFLKAYARTVKEAKQALEKTLTKWDRHEPHYALFLAFLRLFEFARTGMNTLTGRHLDFYYRKILRLREKASKPGHAHLLVELAKQLDSHEFKKGVLFKAGKDDLGKDAFFANDYDFVANQAKVATLKTVYRYRDPDLKPGAPTYPDRERLFASPVANSDDGMGAEPTSLDKSWHPFHNKVYRDGVLSEIKMPKADVGFAIASHYLLMAGGTRTVTVTFKATPGVTEINEHNIDIVCLFTTEKGWFKKEASTFIAVVNGNNADLRLKITLDGADPAVVPYTAKTHGYNFVTNLPLLLVTLKHRDEVEYLYSKLQDVVVNKIDLTVNVIGLKTLAVSNDFGPVDTSKPFQPFGAQPVNGSGFIMGSKEMFQKKLTFATLKIDWQNPPNYYVSTTPNVTSTAPTVGISYLASGQWDVPTGTNNFGTLEYTFDNNKSVVESVDFSENEPYSSASRNGYARLVLQGDLGFKQYQIDLANYLAKRAPRPTAHPGTPIIGPSAKDVSITYEAQQEIRLDLSLRENYEKRTAHFFHIAPFGHAEQHPFLNLSEKVFFLPQFSFQRDGAANKSEAEFYIGLAGLKPPQNLALLFQVADGTADPLSEKPKPPIQHIDWSYLRDNEWMPFAKDVVEDKTDGLLNSGIITFAMPRNASETNTLLPAGMHWIRAAVESGSEAVCRLRLVAAQALKATFTDKGNDPAFPAKALELGTISKLDQPDAAVKKITQPFATFGGRGKEDSKAFYTRVSERLRHKDRGIALWDYERLILEAFPQIYKAKCLNHMEYEPDKYRELAPGHVTVVTIPNQQFHKLRDPFRPFTSLGLLEEIAAFLRKRLSCFVTLHVKNPLFEEIQVKCKVHLKTGLDETFYKKKLNEAITRFLSPWAFPGGGSPSFGGKIYKSALINFVEDLPYVDYVTDFQLFHTFGSSKPVEKNEVEVSRAVSILVSAREHTIEPINPAVAEMPGEKCPCEAQ